MSGCNKLCTAAECKEIKDLVLKNNDIIIRMVNDVARLKDSNEQLTLDNIELKVKLRQTEDRVERLFQELLQFEQNFNTHINATIEGDGVHGGIPQLQNNFNKHITTELSGNVHGGKVFLDNFNKHINATLREGVHGGIDDLELGDEMDIEELKQFIRDEHQTTREQCESTGEGEGEGFFERLVKFLISELTAILRDIIYEITLPIMEALLEKLFVRIDRLIDSFNLAVDKIYKAVLAISEALKNLDINFNLEIKDINLQLEVFKREISREFDNFYRIIDRVGNKPCPPVTNRPSTINNITNVTNVTNVDNFDQRHYDQRSIDQRTFITETTCDISPLYPFISDRLILLRDNINNYITDSRNFLTNEIRSLQIDADVDLQPVLETTRNILLELSPSQTASIPVGQCRGNSDDGFFYEEVQTLVSNSDRGVDRILATLDGIGKELKSLHTDVCDGTEESKNIKLALPDIPIKGCGIDAEGNKQMVIKQSVVKQGALWATGGKLALEFVVPALIDLLFEQLFTIVEDSCNEETSQECVPFPLYPNPDVVTQYPKQGQLQLQFVLEDVRKRGKSDSIWYRDIPNPIDNVEWADLKDYRLVMGNQYGSMKLSGFKNPVSGYFLSEQEGNKYFDLVESLTKESDINRVFPNHSNPQTNILEKRLRIYRAIYIKLDPNNGDVIEKICIQG